MRSRIPNAMIPPFLPANVIADMIHPAETTPAKMDEIAFVNGIFNRKAPIAPVHAPVPGKGTPTNAAREIHCFLGEPIPNSDVFFAARSKIGFIIFCIVPFFKNNKIGMIGNIFPQIHKGNTVVIGNPIQMPTGIAPRNSTTGKADKIVNIP